MSIHAKSEVITSQKPTENEFINDSTFYQGGIYYQLIPDRNGNPDNALAVVDWDPEITNLEIPDSIIPPERIIPEPTSRSSRIGTGETRKYKFIIFFNHVMGGYIVPKDQYKVEKIRMAMDMEFAPNTDFSEYRYLASLDLPDNMKYIPPRTFKNCKGLTSIKIKKMIQTIGEEAFAGCTSLTSVTIEGTSVSSIGRRAFAGCTSLYYLDLSSDYGLRVIDNEAFAGCTKLENVSLPPYITEINVSAFNGCENLSEFHMRDYDDGSFQVYDGALYRKYYKSKELFIVPPAKSTIIIDDTANSIRARVFRNKSNISTIYFPDNIETIGEAAMAGCRNLKKVRLSERIKVISDSCFYGCEGLTAITLPESVNSIGAAAFYGCSSITSMNIPTHTTTISSRAFGGCKSLTNFTVSDWSTEFSVYDGVLYHTGKKNAYVYTQYDWHLIACPAGKKEVTLSENTVHILEFAFDGCDQLTEITIPDKTYSIYPRAFYGCDSLEKFAVEDGNTRYKCEDGILYKYFEDSEGLAMTRYLVAFPGGRAEAVLPSHSQLVNLAVDQYAFYGSKKLETLIFSNLSILSSNFLECPNIKEIHLHNAWLYNSILNKQDFFCDEVYENASLYIYLTDDGFDENMAAEYISSSPVWSGFKNITIVEKSGLSPLTYFPEHKIDFSIENKTILINKKDSDVVRIHDLSGRMIRETLSNRISDMPQGIYILTVNGISQKIRI